VYPHFACTASIFVQCLYCKYSCCACAHLSFLTFSVLFLPLSFSLLFFPWFDCTSARAFVPSHVSSSDRSFAGPVVRPPVRSCHCSIFRTIIRSLVRTFVRPFDRTLVRLSILSFGLLFNFSFVCPFFHLLFYLFVLFSFLLLIFLFLVRLFARPCVGSFARFFVRSIAPWCGRSSALPFDRAIFRSFVRSFVRWSERSSARSIEPFCLSFRSFFWTVCLIFLSSVLFFTLCSIFFPSPYLSFLLLIFLSLVRLFAHPCVRSFVRFFVRSIVRWSDRSSALPFDRAFVRSLVRSFVPVGPIVRPTVQSYLCLSVVRPFDLSLFLRLREKRSGHRQSTNTCSTGTVRGSTRRTDTVRVLAVL